MSSSLCHVCGIYPGVIHSALAHILPYPLCSLCLEQKDGCNGRHMGRPSQLPTFSVEFEIQGASSQDRNRALALLPYGYLRTYDITVDDEYKSPIYHSLTAFRAHVPILESLHDLVNSNCGTHIHIGVPTLVKRELSLWRDTLFGPLVEHLIWNREETRWFWGRATCSYASRDLYASFPCIRTESRYDTLEFRLPRFQHATQYVEVVRFCRRVTNYLSRALLAMSEQGERQHPPEHLGDEVLAMYLEALTQRDQQNRRQTAKCLSPVIIQLTLPQIVTSYNR